MYTHVQMYKCTKAMKFNMLTFKDTLAYFHSVHNFLISKWTTRGVYFVIYLYMYF